MLKYVWNIPVNNLTINKEIMTSFFLHGFFFINAMGAIFYKSLVGLFIIDKNRLGTNNFFAWFYTGWQRKLTFFIYKKKGGRQAGSYFSKFWPKNLHSCLCKPVRRWQKETETQLSTTFRIMLYIMCGLFNIFVSILV